MDKKALDDPDYIDIVAEERTIQDGLNALQFFLDHPVRKGDYEKAVMIANAMKILFDREKRLTDDILLLRTEFENIVGEGIKLKQAMKKFSCRWWTKIFHR